MTEPREPSREVSRVSHEIVYDNDMAAEVYDKPGTRVDLSGNTPLSVDPYQFISAGVGIVTEPSHKCWEAGERSRLYLCIGDGLVSATIYDSGEVVYASAKDAWRGREVLASKPFTIGGRSDRLRGRKVVSVSTSERGFDYDAAQQGGPDPFESLRDYWVQSEQGA